ncbi:hypothetical protein OXX69_001877 [Metschnikowia pulcherrima]
MASQTLKTRAVVALFTLASLVAFWWFVFARKASDEFTPEEVNDLFQNKNSEVHVKRVELPSHAITSPFLDKQSLQSPNWDLSGDIVVQNGQHISLTSDGKHQAGNMFSKQPLSAESFEMELTFHIHGQATLKADGMAVWFVDKQLPLGDVFGAQNNFRGLGIFIDTFRNGRQGDFPLVTAQYSQNYLYYDKHLDGLDTKMASCTAKQLLNPASGKTRMRVVHTKNGYLSVDFNYDPDNSADWHNCFSVMNVKLPSQPYLGISAETGELFENVDIIENRIFALYSPDGDHYIESVDELETIMEQQQQEQQQVPTMGKVPEKQRTRKSVLRLRNAEKRIKEREKRERLQKYGDADATFVRRWSRRVLKAGKYGLYATVVLFAAWIVRITLKSRKSKRGYRSAGLLD